MKVQLLLDGALDCRSGFLNIDPLAPDNDPHGRIRGDVADISHTVDAGEVTELVALDVLDYFPGPQADSVLLHWLSRLAHGGKLTLSVVDLREVCRAFLAGILSPIDTNELLFGRQQAAWQFKKSAFSLLQLAEVLENLGYKVLAKRVQNYRAVITVERA